MISDIEQELKYLLQFDYCQKVSDDIWEKCLHYNKKKRIRQRIFAYIIKQEGRFVLGRLYLNKSRVWYFGKKYFLYVGDYWDDVENLSLLRGAYSSIESLVNGFIKFF